MIYAVATGEGYEGKLLRCSRSCHSMPNVALCDVFVTRHSVLIVPAAPSEDATLTTAVWSEHSGIVDVRDALGVGEGVVDARTGDGATLGGP